MKANRGIKWLATAAGIVLLAASASLAQDPPDHSAYGKLLASHVHNGRVDYRGFKADEARLDVYLDLLSQTNPALLDRNEQMAFYINAYNAWTIKLILGGYPGVNSIKDLGSLFQSPWKKKFVKLYDQTVSLDHIEHDILRPVFKDPRVHFAVNCASISCPPLLGEPYSGKKLDRQLNDAATNFINDGQSNYIDGDTLYASRIFKWFSQDFGNDIAGYIRSYATGDLAVRMQKAGKSLKIEYLDYDWSLNGK